MSADGRSKDLEPAPFVGREWVFDSIHAWLETDDAPRFFLITGLPGSGKSAIARELQRRAGANPDGPLSALAAFHFCSFRRITSIDALSFVWSIATQLARRDRIYAKALEDSKAIHFRPEVQQHVGAAHEVIGIQIGRLDLSGLSPRKAFAAAIVEPLLSANAADEHPKRLVFVIDALDESHTTDGTSITDLLASAEDMPAWVRVIVTNRPNSQLFADFTDHQDLSLSSGDSGARSAAEVAEFLYGALSDLMTDRGRQLDEKEARLIANKAEGNFLWATLVLKELQGGDIEFEALKDTPAGLDGYYYDSVKRHVRATDRPWHSLAGPTFGLLSAALQPLSRGQIETLLQLDATAIRLFLGAFEGFLAEAPAEDPIDNAFSVFHQSLRDFFARDRISIGGKSILNPYFQDRRASHRLFVDHFTDLAARNSGAWNALDDYGLRYLPSHLVEAHLDKQLVAQLKGDFLRAKIDRFHDYPAIREDLGKGLAAAGRDADRASALQFGIVLDSMGERAGSDAVLSIAPLYAFAGEVRRAVDLVGAGAVDWKRAVTLRNIVAVIAESNPQEALWVASRQSSSEGECECLFLILKELFKKDPDLKRHLEVFDRLMNLLGSSSLPRWASAMYALLYRELETSAPAEAEGLFTSAVANARRLDDPHALSEALRRAGQVRVRVDAKAGEQLLRESLEAIASVTRPSDYEAKQFGEIASDLASLDPELALQQVREEEDHFCRFMGLIRIAPFVAAQDLGRAQAILKEAEDNFFFIGIAKAEQPGWQREARSLAIQIESELGPIFEGARAVPSIGSDETSPLVLHSYQRLLVKEEQAELAGVDQALEEPPEGDALARLVVACVYSGHRQSAVKVIQAALRRRAQSSDQSWQAKAMRILFAAVASEDRRHALDLARSLSYGNEDALSGIIQAAAGVDMPFALEVLSTCPIGTSAWSRALAKALIEAARAQDVPALCHLCAELLKFTWRESLQVSDSLAGLRVQLTELANSSDVFGWSDLICNTFADAAVHTARYSISTSRAFIEVVTRNLSGSRARLGKAIDEMGSINKKLATEFAMDVLDAYASKTTKGEPEKSEALFEVVAGLAPHAPEAALQMLKAGVGVMHGYRAMGYSRVASVYSPSDQVLADQLFDKAASDASRAEYEWLKVDAFLCMARDCAARDRLTASRLVVDALEIARSPKRGSVLISSSLAEAAGVMLAVGEIMRSGEYLDEACDRMNRSDSDSLDLEAILAVCRIAPIKAAERASIKLLNALCERSYWSSRSGSLLRWSDHIVELMLLLEGDMPAARKRAAEALLQVLEDARKLEEAIFVG